MAYDVERLRLLSSVLILLSRVLQPLFRQLAACMESQHAIVAERAHYLYNNEVIVRHIARCKETVFPIVFGALARNTKGETCADFDGSEGFGHWSQVRANLLYMLVRRHQTRLSLQQVCCVRFVLVVRSCTLLGDLLGNG
jgi:hypothetical protein